MTESTTVTGDTTPRVAPVSHYALALAALLILTAVTAGVSSLRLAHGALAVALAIAALKAGVVAAVFMHLRHDAATLRAVPVLALFLAALLFGLSALDWAPRDAGGRPATQISNSVARRLSE
jgi:cytochrome c oxidase subunit 4